MANGVLCREEALRTLREHCTDLQRLGMRRIGLFGSVLRDAATVESDVDFLMEFTEAGHTYDNLFDACELLESWLVHRVEAVTPEGLRPHLAPHILREVEYVTMPA